MFNRSKILTFDQLGSTNNYLLDLLQNNKSNVDEGTVVLTPEQNDGRGTGANKWESEANKNLTFSLLLRPVFLAADEQFYLSKMISLALVDVVGKLINAQSQIKIKWPNDIFVGNKKLAGILIENAIAGNSFLYSVVGIGLNVNQESFGWAPNAVSLKMLNGQHFDMNNCLDEILKHIEIWYSHLQSNRALIDKMYLENLYRYNQTCQYKKNDELFEATINGVDEFGRLLMVNSTGVKLCFDFKEIEFIINQD